MIRNLRFALVTAPFLLLAACASATAEETEDGYGDTGEDEGPLESNLETGTSGLDVPEGATLRTTANLNFRMGPSLSATIQRVLAKGTVVVAAEGGRGENGFLQVNANGLNGWMFMKYLALDEEAPEESESEYTGLDDEPSPDNAVTRAKSGMGFSYRWGGGAWDPDGATQANKGSCSGSCPNCSHRGTYGADCSGFVAKVWQFGDKDISKNGHPFGTADFNQSKTGYWKRLADRKEVQKGDALVYRANGVGHIVLYERGDAWGSPVVYECKGCSYGCVYNARTLGSGYKGIRRDGF